MNFELDNICYRPTVRCLHGLDQFVLSNDVDHDFFYQLECRNLS